MKRLIVIVPLVFVGIFWSGCGSTLQTAVYSQMGDHYYINGSYRDAFESYKKSAEIGDGYSYYRLYSIYHLGLGMPKDSLNASKMLEEAARLGYPAAETTLANRLIFTTPKKQDIKRGIALLESAASKEHPYAYADLYTIYWHGIGVKKDPKKAGEYHRLAQANGFDVRSALPVKSVSSETETKAMIISVQTGLKSLGFYKGTVDGVSGPMTSKAIITFQQFHGYRVDDKITQDLVDKINSKL